MSHSLFALASELEQVRKPFVLATVVWCERPTSSKPGAQAIIDTEGTITGWIGGSCAQPVVVREALRAIREGDGPYLLRLGTSDAATVRSDMKVFPMTCSSGGVLDIYIEPHLPLPQLLLIGDSPVNVALGKLASVLDFAVIPVEPTLIGQAEIDARTSIVIATHGEYDEEVLEHVLRSPAAYIGMVASHRRADVCRDNLRASGMDEASIERLQAPAGLDLGAVTPEEIAATILAELVRVRHQPIVSHDMHQEESTTETAQAEAVERVESGNALDVVCNMTVEIVTARHHMTYDGREFYFCCPACKRAFEREPQKYLVQSGT